MIYIVFLIIPALAVAVKYQSECPEQLSIAPCVCNVIEERPNIECSNINVEDELEDIFSSDFPDTAIHNFTLTNSYLPRLTRNVFGNVTFDEVYIALFYLQEISEDVFENSEGTLRIFEVFNTPVSQNTFPFASLSRYTGLVQLSLRNNNISAFPTIVSKSLQFLFILGNDLITNIPSYALASMANLTSLDLQSCGIATIEKNAFRGSGQLLHLSLKYNKIATIRADIFAYLPYLLELNLSRNNISEMEKEALAYMPSLIEVNLGYNYLEYINPRSFVNYKLEKIDLIYNKINQIQPGTFGYLPKLKTLDLGYNKLTRLVNGGLRGVRITSGILYIDLNNIDYIETNAFGVVVKSNIYLGYNNLETLDKCWLKILLDAQNEVHLQGNPTTCGCEISWLFEDSSYQNLLEGRCSNGTWFQFLDPSWYQENC